MTTKVKATKRLKDLDFSGEGAAVALVGPAVGSAANNRSTILLKSKFTDEHIAKAAKIRVTMEPEEFLTRFMGMWADEACVLARVLGLETPEDEMQEDEPQSYEDYITSKVEAIEIIKSLADSEDVKKALADLEPDDYLALLRSQQLLEKAWKKLDKDSKPVVKATVEEGTPALATAKVENPKPEAVPSGEINKSEKSKMTKEVKTVEQEVTVEMVEKAALLDVQKALKEQSEQLTKALETVKQFEIEKAAAIAKARKDLLVATVKDEAKVEAFVKGLANVESEEVFQGVIKALSDMMTVQTQSALFKEQGASVEEVTKSDETPLMKAAKAFVAKQAQSTK